MIEIKKIKMTDAKFIQENLSEWFVKIEPTLSNIKQCIKEWKNSLVFCIVYNKIPVGIISLGEREEKTLVFGIRIIEEYRNKGIGTEAFKLACSIAKEQGYKCVISSCAKTNLASKRMHEKLNFDLLKLETNPAGYEMYRWAMDLE